MKQQKTFVQARSLESNKQGSLRIFITMAVATILALVSMGKATAQTSPARMSAELGLLHLNLKVEKNLASEFSIDGRLGLGGYFVYREFSFLGPSSDGGYKYKREKLIAYGLSPFVEVGANWYYNLQEREAAGKKVANNSANYLRPSITYQHSSIFNRPDYVSKSPQIDILLSWGLRRQLSEKFFFDFNVGAGASIPDPIHNIEPLLNIKIGVGFSYLF